MSNKDSLYAQQRDLVTRFSFDADVARVFPDMIQRSVPGYETIIHMIGHLAETRITEGSIAYDLGCSLGAATLSMLRSSQAEQFCIEAIDNSPAMTQSFIEQLESIEGAAKINVRCNDLQTTTIASASIVVMNFTLQFIPLSQRQAIIQTIYDGLLPGGVLVLSEKLAFEDAHLQRLFIEMHENFKRANGYTDLEIAQKRTALENTLIPETLTKHRARLQQAGFRCVDVWFQCFNFASIIAIKQ